MIPFQSDFTVPADITIECAADTSVTSTGTVSGTIDNCGVLSLVWNDSIVSGLCIFGIDNYD